MTTYEPSGRSSAVPRSRAIAAAIALLVIVALAVPALAADPTAEPTAEPSATAAPTAAPTSEPTVAPTAAPTAAPASEPRTDPAPGVNPAGRERGGPKESITLRGPVTSTTAANGRTDYALTAGGKTWELGMGPPWFYGDDHPLKAFVGRTVTIEGRAAAGGTKIDVFAVNGTILREEGRPPWAGGWMRVGKAHPGWSQERADRLKARFGGCFPPGLCKRAGAGD